METHSLLPVIGVLVAAAITPGPNNFMVMEASARGGFAAAWSVVLGVMLGSLLLLALIFAGVARAMQVLPIVGTFLSVGGGAYLAWLGASSFLRREQDDEAQRSTAPASVLGAASFQLFNPKAWLLTTTAAAAMSGNGGVFTLAALTVLVTGICLSIWAVAGSASRHFLQPRGRLWFDRTMGGLLVLSAVGIAVDALAR
jgi:threonine/homoserine/homoserine lactone efflux protein